MLELGQKEPLADADIDRMPLWDAEGDLLWDPELQKVLVTEALAEMEGEGVPVRQSVGEYDWEVEGLSDTDPLCVSETLLHPDTDTLAD